MKFIRFNEINSGQLECWLLDSERTEARTNELLELCCSASINIKEHLAITGTLSDSMRDALLVLMPRKEPDHWSVRLLDLTGNPLGLHGIGVAIGAFDKIAKDLQLFTPIFYGRFIKTLDVAAKENSMKDTAGNSPHSAESDATRSM